MDNTKKTQYIVLGFIAILMIIVISFTINSIIKYQNRKDNETTIKLNQLYSSDYNITPINKDYYIGSYNEGKIDVIINNNGQEIFKAIEEIPYEKIYRLKDGRYLIYNNLNNILTTYIFDGEKLSEYHIIPETTYIKPILYKGPEYDYILGFYENKDNDLYIYNIDTLDPTVIKNKSIITDSKEADAFYINNEKYLTVKGETSVGVIDFSGNEIIPSQYQNIISTNKDTFIIENKDKYGIVDSHHNILLKPDYKAIKPYDKYYLVVNSNNKMALFDENLNNLTGFKMKYDPLLEYDLRNTNSLYINKLNGNIIIANNYLEDTNGTKYSNHELYIIKKDKLWQTIEQKGFFTDTFLYVYDSNYKITIYDSNYEQTSEIPLNNVSKILDIKSLSEDIIKIDYLDESNNKITKYYNNKGIETDNKTLEYGESLHDNYLFHAYLKKEDNKETLTIFTSDFTKNTNISGNNIELIDDCVIVDNAIYKIEISK